MPTHLFLARQLSRIVEGDVAEVARRAGMSVRQLRYMRAGKHLNITLDTLDRLADALGVAPAVLISGAAPRARRPAPIGKKIGKPRTMRREPRLGEPNTYDEDNGDFDREA